MARIELQDKHKENWYALIIAILAKEELTVEEALAFMRIYVHDGGPVQYMSLRQKGYSWKHITYITGTKNPRTIVQKFRKRLDK